MTLAEFMNNQPGKQKSCTGNLLASANESEVTTVTEPELPKAEIDRCNEMLRLLDIAFEECKVNDKAQREREKRQAEELALKERKKKIFRPRTSRPGKRN